MKENFKMFVFCSASLFFVASCSSEVSDSTADSIVDEISGAIEEVQEEVVEEVAEGGLFNDLCDCAGVSLKVMKEAKESEGGFSMEAMAEVTAKYKEETDKCQELQQELLNLDQEEQNKLSEELESSCEAIQETKDLMSQK